MRFAPGVKINGIRPELAAVIPAIGHLIGVHSMIQTISPRGDSFLIRASESDIILIVEDLRKFLPEDMIIETSGLGVVVKAPKATQVSGQWVEWPDPPPPQNINVKEPGYDLFWKIAHIFNKHDWENISVANLKRSGVTMARKCKICGKIADAEVKPDKPWPRSNSNEIEVFHPFHREFRVTVIQDYHDIPAGSRPVIQEESQNYYRGLLPEGAGTSEVTIPKLYCAFWKWEDEL